MTMFIDIFLMCFIAQSYVCGQVQPVSTQVKIQAENATADHKSTIFSVIRNAGKCVAYKDLRLDAKFRQLEEYCERPLPDTPRANEFLSYEVVLCMVLFDAVQRFCKVGHQEVTKDLQNFSGGFSCNNMIKGVPEAFAESSEQWVTIFKAKLGSISDCERACIQDKMVSPVCEYIWKTNTMTYQAQVSSATSADMSPSENLEVNSKGHGKTNKTMTSKDKPLKAKTFDLSSAAGPGFSIPNSGSQKPEQVDDTMTQTNTSHIHKDVDLAEANGNSTQSGSAHDVKNNAKEQAHTKGSSVQNDSKQEAQATLNTGHNDTKKQAYTADNNTQNDINKPTHGTNSSAQNIMKKQEQAINNSNQSAEVTSPNTPVSLSVHTERTPETGKYDGSTGFKDSKSNTAPQLENKSSAGVYASDSDMENQNGDNDFVVTTYENADKFQDTGLASNIPSGDEDQEEERTNTDNQDEQHDQTSKQTETHQGEAETGNTAQFNQLGDAADSHFYAYFMTMVVICIIGYLVFHNKQKILALALEGRSRRGTRRRPNTSAYRKLDSNLEEAVTSTGSTSVTHVIY